MDHRSAALFEQLMRGRIAGVAIVAPDGSFIRVNPALCEFFGRPHDELMLATWQELTHPDDVEVDLKLLQEVLNGDRDEYRLRKRYLRPDGEVTWGDLSVSCVREPNGSVSCFISQIIDVTPLVAARQELAAREQHYRLVVEHSSDVVVMNRVDGTIQWVSSNVEGLTGYRPDELIGRNALEVLVAPDDRAQLQQALRNAAASSRSARTVFSLQRKDGSAVFVEAAGESTRDSDGEAARVVRWRNVDTEVRAVRRLQQSEQLFRTAMAASAVGMATLGLDRRFTRVNAALSEMVGRDEQWLLFHGIADLLEPPDDLVDREVREGLLSGAQTAASIDKQLRTGDGRLIDVRHAIGLLRDERGHPTGYVSQFMDMTEVNRARRAMEFLVTHDQLTKVHNRRGILGGLTGVLHQQRTGDRTGLVYIDLDNFKPVNDRFGHGFGDQVLEVVARRLRATVRSDDLVGRLGGDEFVVVLLGLHGGSEVDMVANKIRMCVAGPMTIERQTVRVTASLGMTLAVAGDSADSLLQRADAALYQSKRAGGDRVTIL